MYLLNKSIWLQDIAAISQYMYAYYNGDVLKSVYTSQGARQTGKDMPYVARLLALVATLFSRESSDPFEYIQAERGLRYDPDLVDDILVYKEQLKSYCAFYLAATK